MRKFFPIVIACLAVMFMIPLAGANRGDSGFAIFDIEDFSPGSVVLLHPNDPVDFRAGGLESDQFIFLRPEQLSFRSGTIQNPDLFVDVDREWLQSNGNLVHKFQRPFFGQQTQLTSNGPRYNSYYLHFDPVGDSPRIATTIAKIRFENPIVGIIFTGDSDENYVRGTTLDDTQWVSFNPDVIYPVNADFRRQGSFDGHPAVNFIQVNDDGRTITISLACRAFHMDNVRIITLANSEK